MKKTGTDKASRRRGGRPSQAQAARLREKILDAAATVFFAEGYGAATIEAIAKRAKIAKRTLYARFRDKADLFEAVVRHLLEELRPPKAEALFEGSGREIFVHLAEVILYASLNPKSVALQRVITGEVSRFPELASVMQHVGAREEAVSRIAMLLENEVKLGNFNVPDPTFAAEQFLQMITTIPLRRAMGLGKPMTAEEIKNWPAATVALFLKGVKKN